MNGIVTRLVLVMLLVGTSIAMGTSETQPVSQMEKQEALRTVRAFQAGETLNAEQLNLLDAIHYNYGQINRNEIDDFGGPDTFGHLWIDSNEQGGPTYNWIDISATGTNIAPLLSDDDTEGPIEIGFNFPFYSDSYSQLWVQSNGTLTFTGDYLSYGNTDLPYDWGADNDSFVGWAWNDLDPDSGNDGDIYYETIDFGDRLAFVMSYVNVAEYPWDGSAEHFTGQVILYDDGEILIQFDYFEEGFDTATTTIGIQNNVPDDFLQVCGEGEQYQEEGLAILMYMAEPDASLSGTITSSVGGQTVEDAIVKVGPWTTTTNANGQYLVETLYGGFSYDVEVIGPNYYIWRGTTNISVGPNTFDIEIEPFPAPYSGSYATDFENGQGLFEFEPGDDWEFGTPTFWPNGAHSGENTLSTILDGSYNNNRDDWLLMTETFLIGEVESSLSYWHWFNYEAMNDGYNVQVSVDGMETWEVLIPDSGYNDPDGVFINGYQPCWNNSGPGAGAWTQVNYDLGIYNGQQIWIAFRHTTNESNNIYSGVTIDDVEVNVGTPPTGLMLELTGTVTTIPPGGGTVLFDAVLTSTRPSALTLDGWTFVTTPSGTTVGPIFNVDILVSPGTAVFTDLPQSVPSYAPGGTYTYAAYIGLLPGIVGTQDSFTFTKIGADPNGGGSWYDETWATAMQTASSTSSTVTLPDEFGLGDAYPNPFNPSTSMKLFMPMKAEVTVQVFNVMGQEVKILVDGQLSAGTHTLTMEAESLSSGVYFVRATFPGGLSEIRKITLIR